MKNFMKAMDMEGSGLLSSRRGSTDKHGERVVYLIVLQIRELMFDEALSEAELSA